MIKLACCTLVWVCLIACSFNAVAQSSMYVTVTSVNPVNGYVAVNYPVQTNQVVSVVGYDWTDGPAIWGNLANGTQITLTPYFFTYYQQSSPLIATGSKVPEIITGLTNISVKGGGVGGPGWATFQITTPASASVTSNYVPADAIVIPSTATGNVQIILESSPDLVNWTAASPGTYSATGATNRFFRVRAVGQ